MISCELQSLLLASSRQSCCTVSRRMKHLLQAHRCCSRPDTQLAPTRAPPLPVPPLVSTSAPLWHLCERLQSEPLSDLTYNVRITQRPHQTESPLPLVLLAATSPPPPRPSPKQEDRRSRQAQEDLEAIERIKKEVKRFQDRTAIAYKNPCKVSASYSKSCTMDELNAVKYHLEEFIPRFFVSLMDYSLFTPDVVYINEMQVPSKTSRGVYRLSVDRVKMKLYYDLRYAMKKPVILRIDTDQANCCMAIRLRIRCVGGSKPFTHLAQMNRLGTAAYIEEKGEWHDYLIYVHVTNDARVWQLRITNLTEDRSPDAAAARPSFVQRLRQLLRRRAPLPAAV